MSRRVLSVLSILVLLVAAPVLAQSWRRLPGAQRFARPGAPAVTLEVRASGGFGCGGGGCNGGIEIRNVRGELPSEALSYFYSDRPGAEPACPASSARESFFEDWTEIEIAPARGGEDERPACGIGVMIGDAMQYWVILRTRRASAAR